MPKEDRDSTFVPSPKAAPSAASGAFPPDESDNTGKSPEQWAPVLDDRVTVRKIIRWLTEPATLEHLAAQELPAEDDQDYRPRLRPPTPILTILDDGTREHGENIRLRQLVFSIGRTEGDLCLPNDAAVSHLHAEIRRVPWKGGFQWHLHDLTSRNGTFARCARAVLHDQVTLILGNARLRFRNPLRPAASPPEHQQTRAIDSADIPASGWPSLVDTTSRGSSISLLLKQDSMTLGRAGGGAHLQLDDPLLANHHATLRRMRDGTWMIEAEQTRNGLWISINTVQLGSNCFFRCGEQQFRFWIP